MSQRERKKLGRRQGRSAHGYGVAVAGLAVEGRAWGCRVRGEGDRSLQQGQGIRVGWVHGGLGWEGPVELVGKERA